MLSYFTMQNLIESLKNLEESDFNEKINLHIHTTCSDGSLTPIEVIEKAKQDNFKLISMTDHNSVEAYEQICHADLRNLNIITGVEFDCWYKSNFIHILGYGIDVNNEKIEKLCSKNPSAKKVDLVRFFNTRKAKDVINAIKEAQGISILAHPACCWNLNLKKMLRELQNIGLDGVEVYYPYVGHRKIVKFYSIKEIQQYASELNLLVTGGTDCHSRDLKGR
jgi:predicted metal-dependent phosphoesterase TrpH